MPNTREKLIELLDEATEKLKELCGGLNEINGNGVRADHLINNGVTVTDTNVGKWIPVLERLPDRDTLVLCVGAKGGMFLGYVRNLYVDDINAFTIVPNSRSARYTKYWMPLPESPKGE